MEILYGAQNAFGYNSAKTKPIWMKSGALRTHCWGLDLADFGRDPSSSKLATVWEAAEMLLFLVQYNNARFRRFPVGNI